MHVDESLKAKVLAAIHEDEVAELARDLAEIPSPTGFERDVAEYIAQWLETNGFTTIRQIVEEDRFNVIGRLQGTGDGPSLMFNGHMDINLFGLSDQLVDLPTLPEDEVRQRLRSIVPRAYIEDGYVVGYQVVNMKAAIAGFMIAMKAIRESAGALNGDLIAACVVGEIGTAPVDGYQGKAFNAKGHGTRYLLRRGIVSDYAICADASEFGITWAECGVVYLKITTHGKAMYTPFTERSSTRAVSNNAILQMLTVIDAIEDWAEGYEKATRAERSELTIQPKVNLGAIRGGAPYRPSLSPSFCSAYVDIRVPPGTAPQHVIHDFQQMITRTGVDCTVTPFVTQQGFEGVGVEPIVQALRQAYKDAYGTEPPRIPVPFTSMWSDTNCYNEVGIPCVKFGPAPRQGDSRVDTEHRQWIRDRIPIADLAGAARVYALAALTLCNGAASV